MYPQQQTQVLVSLKPVSCLARDAPNNTKFYITNDSEMSLEEKFRNIPHCQPLQKKLHASAESF